jgi:hypothetical protein
MEIATGERAEEVAYESYLDAALRGAAEEPAVFLARHPEVGPVERARIEALHRLALGAPKRPAAPPPGAAAEPGLPWERLGDFRLLRRLGAGGMGMVFEAEQAPLGRTVALKVIRPHLRTSPEAMERFRREARAAARLRHPNIVAVLSAGEQEGVRWIAMDLAPGEGLDGILARARDRGEPVPPARAARWGARLARALEFAHARGIVHRDVKPSNVRVGPDDQPLLLDFGIARDEDAASTITGPFLGSPHYASPEQIAGLRSDGRVDVYGLGATLYECLSGAPPFPAGTVDRVIHRVLTEDPRPLRGARPGIPRDLEAVVLRALEKNPEGRYAGAREMAEDLEALLEFRPVKARPAGLGRRLRSWARARPALASAAATGIAAALALGAFLAVSAREAAMRTRREAAGEVAAARERLEAFRRGRAQADEAEKEMARLHGVVETMYFTEGQDREIETLEDRVHALRRDREGAFHAALEHLRRAEQIDPAVESADPVRAALYLERWRDSAAAGDGPAAEFYRGLALSHDPGGTVTRGALGAAEASILSDPPGAEVHLFRFVERAGSGDEGEARLVPVPVRGTPGVPPGSFALRVVRGAGGLVPGDLLVEVAGFPVRDSVLVTRGAGAVERLARLVSADGEPIRDEWEAEQVSGAPVPGTTPKTERVLVFEKGGRRTEVRGADLAALGIEVAGPRAVAEAGAVPARAWTGGALRDVVLPEGLALRPTAIPLPLSPATVFGRTPMERVSLERGSYLAVFRMAGREEQRFQVRIEPGPQANVLRVSLLPEGTTPPGFVRIPAVTPRDRPFWIQEREVTSAEYLEFLNDPETLAAIDGGKRRELVPRGSMDAEAHWPRGKDGRFALSADWRADWPALGITYGAAVAYAGWRTRRQRAAGGTALYSLPAFGQWLLAGCASDRFYVFGNRFRAKWAKSCYARRRAYPEPVLRFPRDESPHGVFDMAGGVSEWLDDWFDEPRGLRKLAGGSWAYAKSEMFKIYGSLGFPPDRAGDEAGLRLVRVEEGGP